MTSSVEMSGIAAVVVTHESASTIDDCLMRLRVAHGVHEIRVVDNASTDDTMEIVQRHALQDARLRFIANPDNPGFAVGCNQGARDTDGNIQPDPARFPSGMKALADYVHGLGLKFGLYSDAGTQTCGGRPGSRGYEYQDARQYAAWGVDYLKYDWCNTGTQEPRASYLTMSEALRASGRPIVFSICDPGGM